MGVNNQYYNDFVARFDAATGNIIRIDTLYSGQGVNEYVTALVTDHRGNFYLGGEFSGDITIAGTTYIKQDGFTDGYIAKLGSSDCSNCTPPAASFSYTGTEPAFDFTYNGSGDADSVVWSFGDGQTLTGGNVGHTYAAAGTYTVCATAYSSCGQDQFCLTIDVIGLGLDSNLSFPGLEVYPNPTTGILSVKGIQSQTNYSIYTNLGNEVKRGTMSLPGDIVMKDLAPGCYLLDLKDEKGAGIRIRVILR